MLLPHLLAFILSIALAPCLTSAALFPKGSLVKSIDTKGFRKAMKENQTCVVAFVAPWCGHCQRMVPEYSKAAKGLHPLIPLYAVDCDAEENKPLCGEQGVQGFPTVKLFPRGSQAPPILHNGERNANSFYYWASRNVPHGVKKLKTVNDITKWIKTDKPHALLLHKAEKLPLLWQVIANKYKHRMDFGFSHDSNGKSSIELGLKPGGEKENKILVYTSGSEEPILYEGVMKAEAISKFFKSVIKGTIDLKPKKNEEDTSYGDKQEVFEAPRDTSTDEGRSGTQTPDVGDGEIPLPSAVADSQEPQPPMTASKLGKTVEENDDDHSDEKNKHLADEL